MEDILDLIKKYNLKVQPMLIKQREGSKDRWYAGPMKILSDYINGVPNGAGCFGETLEEAVLNTVRKISNENT